MSPQREASGVDGAVELVCGGGSDRTNAFTGWCIARMLERGERVEMLTQNPSEPRTWEPADPYDFQSTDRTFYVARVLPAPATQTIRADELRPGMKLADGRLVRKVTHEFYAFSGGGNEEVRWWCDGSRPGDDPGRAALDAPVSVLSPVPTGEGTGAPASKGTAPAVNVASAAPARVEMTLPDGSSKTITRVPLREVFQIFDPLPTPAGEGETNHE